MSNNRAIRRVCIIGTGVIGASWASLFLAKGLDVIATDIAKDAEASLRRFVQAAWPALERLGLTPGASQSRLSFTPDMPAAVQSADFVQENGPERIDFKFGRHLGLRHGMALESELADGEHAQRSHKASADHQISGTKWVFHKASSSRAGGGV